MLFNTDSMTILQSVICLLVGLGILLVGFRLLSENIQKVANKGLKKMFNKKSKNYFAEVGIGAAATAIMHSSAASTVMVVGFVNAGVMTLHQATAMIMGANIGTTITAQIAALGTFDVSTYAMLLAIIGVFVNMIFKKDSVKALGLGLSGLGLVFIGLKLMSSAMSASDLKDAINPFLENCSNPFLLLFAGMAITALIQSSTAVTTIVISMAAAGISVGGGGNHVLFVILGSNIGTCITALISSVGTNANAKRASLIHLLFNLAGAIIFFIILMAWPNFMDATLAKWFAGKPATQIAMFHTLFNVTCTIIFMPFISLFVKVSTWMIKDVKKGAYQESYIDERFLKSPSIALQQATKEAMRLGKLSMLTLSMSIDAFVHKDLKLKDDIYENIKDIETLNQNLLAYMVKVSTNQPGRLEEKTMSKIHQVTNDFYREVEIADNMMKYTKTTIDNELVFSEKVIEQIKTLQDDLLAQFANVEEIYINNRFELIKNVDELEEEIDNLRSLMIAQHIERLEKNECSPANSGVFINLVSNLERAGDHLNYIAHTIVEDDVNKNY